MTQQVVDLREYEARLARRTRNASVVALVIVGVIAAFFGEATFERKPMRFAYAFLFTISMCVLVCIISIRRLNKLTANSEVK